MHRWFAGGITLALIGFATQIHAITEQVPVGARAVGMGGAFSAIADDATGLFWNPAGLAAIGHQEVAASRADLFDAGINESIISGVLPLSLRHALAFGFYHSGFGDTELDFGESHFQAGYSGKFHNRFSVGMSAKYLTRNVSLDNNSLSKGWGVGVDVGVLATPLRDLRVGLVALDVLDTRLHYSDEGTRVVYPRNVRAAVAYTLLRSAVVALDVDDRFHLGAEYNYRDLFAVRGGVQRDIDGESDPTYSAGVGLKAKYFRFNYAYEMPPELPSTHHYSLAAEFNFNPSLIKVSDVKIDADALYASQYRSYATTPFGQVKLTNTTDDAITAKLHVSVPKSWETETVTEIVVRPGQQTVPLTAVFPPAVLETSGDRQLRVDVSTSYMSAHLIRTDKGHAKCVGYASGAIRWSDGSDRAAAFVTTQDPVIEAFAHDAVRAARARQFDYPNLQQATAVFDALGTLGLTYTKDPDTPFDVVSKERSIDTIRYPRVTMALKQGDCDDSAVLVAALFGNLGIDTRLVTVPGHIFVMFDAGLKGEDHEDLALPRSRYVIAEGRVWIPVETTVSPNGFMAAWQQGAETYARWEPQSAATTVDISRAQAQFPPAQPTGEARAAPSIDATKLQAAMSRDAAIFRDWRLEYLKGK